MRRFRIVSAAVAVLIAGLCFAGGKDVSKETGRKNVLYAINRKKVNRARDNFLKLYRKVKKPKSGPGRVIGFVVNKNNYSGIKGVVVKVAHADKPESKNKSYDAVSGKGGTYEIQGLRSGRYTVETAADGYLPYKRENVFVKPGVGPGLGRWLVIELERPTARSGSLQGDLKFIDPAYKHIKVLVAKAEDDWKDIEEKEIVLLSESDEDVVKSIKRLKVGVVVKCRFVKRSGRYTLINVDEEKMKR